mgnify:CR=1 FL=1
MPVQPVLGQLKRERPEQGQQVQARLEQPVQGQLKREQVSLPLLWRERLPLALHHS